MTKDEIRAKVAELIGDPQMYALVKRGFYYRPNAKGYTTSIQEAGRYTKEEAKEHVYQHDEPVTMMPFPTPDYPNDLNACSEMEKTLTTQDEWLAYESAVMTAANYKQGEWQSKTKISATAEQRCRAFIAVKNAS